MLATTHDEIIYQLWFEARELGFAAHRESSFAQRFGNPDLVLAVPKRNGTGKFLVVIEVKSDLSIPCKVRAGLDQVERYRDGLAATGNGVPVAWLVGPYPISEKGHAMAAERGVLLGEPEECVAAFTDLAFELWPWLPATDAKRAIA